MHQSAANRIVAFTEQDGIFLDRAPDFAVEDFSDGLIWGVVRFTIRWQVARAALRR